MFIYVTKTTIALSAIKCTLNHPTENAISHLINYIKLCVCEPHDSPLKKTGQDDFYKKKTFFFLRWWLQPGISHHL